MPGLLHLSKLLIWFFTALGFLWHAHNEITSKKAIEKAGYYVYEAGCAESKSRYKEAFEYYGKAIAACDKYYAAYNNRGHLKYILGLPREALKDFNKAISIDPYFDCAYSNRAIIYYQIRDDKRAAADFSKAIELYPSRNNFKTRAEFWKAIGNSAEARKDLELAKLAQNAPPYSRTPTSTAGWSVKFTVPQFCLE